MDSKSFINEYEDYSLDSAEDIIDDLKIKNNSKIYNVIDTFENKIQFMKKAELIDPSDYTVFTGTTGIALLFLLKSVQNKSFLNEALTFLNAGRLRNRRYTFLCGDAGPLAVGAVVHSKLGNNDEAKKLTEKLLSYNTEILNVKSDLPNELLYGRVGYLYALLFVNSHVKPEPVNEKLIKKIIEVIFMLGKNEARKSGIKVPLMYQWHGKRYLGAAHGLSGIMYILLQAKQYLSQSELNDLIKPTIDYLCEQRYASGNFMSSLQSDTDRLVQWCHGAPGFTHLFTKAYEVYGDAKYLNLALECGEIVWKRGLLRKGYSICHGVSGNGYTFLNLFQTTQDPKHLYRAIKFAEWTADYNDKHQGHKPDNPLSLFEGMAGRLYFLEDIKDPMKAKFPGYTL